MPVDPWLRVKLKDGLLESFSIDDFRDFLSETLGQGLADLHSGGTRPNISVSYTHLRAHETRGNLVCRLLLEKKK